MVDRKKENSGVCNHRRRRWRRRKKKKRTIVAGGSRPLQQQQQQLFDSIPFGITCFPSGDEVLYYCSLSREYFTAVLTTSFRHAERCQHGMMMMMIILCCPLRDAQLCHHHHQFSSVQFSGLTALSASGIVGTICVFVCPSVYVLLFLLPDVLLLLVVVVMVGH